MSDFGDRHLDPEQHAKLMTAIVLPREIQAAVVANPHLLQPLIDAVRRAVEVSFAHQQTKMNVITGNEVTRRGEICMQVMEMAYAEQNYSILQMVDALPSILIDVLMRNQRGNELIEQEHQQGRWTTGDGDPETEALCELDGVVDSRMVAPDPEGADEVFDEDDDLTEGVEPEPFSDEEFDEFKEAQDA
jgi:hypothetical protein